MKRPIKFRIWDSVLEEMLFQEDTWLQYRDRESYWITDLEDALADQTRFEVMQFAGVKDIHENDSFEGDIIEMTDEWDDRERFIIIWYETGFFLKEIDGDGIDDRLTTLDSFEIIGNIYEN